jgi:hypothetical protein
MLRDCGQQLLFVFFFSVVPYVLEVSYEPFFCAFLLLSLTYSSLIMLCPARLQWNVLDDFICIQMLHKNDQPRDRIFLTGYSHACELKAAFETVVAVHLKDPRLALSNTQVAKKVRLIIISGIPMNKLLL